jgi:hypothetical protein
MCDIQEVHPGLQEWWCCWSSSLYYGRTWYYECVIPTTTRRMYVEAGMLHGTGNDFHVHEPRSLTATILRQSRFLFVLPARTWFPRLLHSNTLLGHTDRIKMPRIVPDIWLIGKVLTTITSRTCFTLEALYIRTLVQQHIIVRTDDRTRIKHQGHSNL